MEHTTQETYNLLRHFNTVMMVQDLINKNTMITDNDNDNNKDYENDKDHPSLES